jgi:hypothetical protein
MSIGVEHERFILTATVKLEAILKQDSFRRKVFLFLSGGNF